MTGTTSSTRVGSDGTLVLTSSYPAFRGDFSGHFVAARVGNLARQGPVIVGAAGAGLAAAPEENVKVLWLGGKGLFGYPGALSRIRENPLRLWWLPSVLARAFLRLLRHRGTVEVHWLLPFGLLAALAQRFGGGSPEIFAHGSDVRLLCRAPKWVRGWVVSEMRRAGGKLCLVSEELRNELGAGLSPRLTEYVRNSRVAPAELEVDAAPPDRLAARVRLSLPPKARVIVVVARLISTKRVDVALSALRLLGDALIVCVGDGPLADKLSKEFPEVSFVGRCSRDVALTWIRAADLLVSASQLEGAPTVVREALALGTMVVSAEVGDLKLWAKEHEALFLVPRSEGGRPSNGIRPL